MVNYEGKINNYKACKDRIWELDVARGFCMLLMIFDHFMVNLATGFYHFHQSPVLRPLSRIASAYFVSDLRVMGWILILGLFVFLSGISSGLTKNNLYRGVKLLLVAYLLTFSTQLLSSLSNTQMTINFGVLHMLSFSILTYAFCVEQGKIKIFSIRHFEIYLSDLLCIILVVVVGYLTSSNSIPLFFQGMGEYDNLFQLNIGQYFNFLTGVYPTALNSADYLPILPWLAIFLIGSLVSKKFYPDKRSLFPSCGFMSDTPLAKLGKISLLVYIVHQPIIYALLSVIGLIFTGQFILF